MTTARDTDNRIVVHFPTWLHVLGGITSGWVTTPIIAGIIISVAGVIIKRKYEEAKSLREKMVRAREELEEFELKLQMFIRKQLKEFYEEEWWGKGVPQFISAAIEPKIKKKLIKSPDLSLLISIMALGSGSETVPLVIKTCALIGQ